MGSELTNLLDGRFIYHATPMHYLPRILAAGELRSQRLVGYAMGRLTARRRDRILNVDQYIHFSLTATTPLLKQKLELGFPHVVLRFSADFLHSCQWAILPCSTKAWRSKWQCQPITDCLEVGRILRLFDEGKRFRGLEILVKDRVPLSGLLEIATHSEQEAELVQKICRSLGDCEHVSIRLCRNVDVPNYDGIGIQEITDYFVVCCALRQSFSPPELQFD